MVWANSLPSNLLGALKGPEESFFFPDGFSLVLLKFLDEAVDRRLNLFIFRSWPLLLLSHMLSSAMLLSTLCLVFIDWFVCWNLHVYHQTKHSFMYITKYFLNRSYTTRIPVHFLETRGNK